MSVAEQRRKFLASTSTDGGHYAHHGHHLGMTHSKSSTQPPPALQPQGTKSLSSSLPTTIPNLEENKVKIQVPGGGVHHSAVNAAAIVVKQSSIDKGKNIDMIIVLNFALFCCLLFQRIYKIGCYTSLTDRQTDTVC